MVVLRCFNILCARLSVLREFKLYRVYTYQVVLVDRGVLRILQLETVPRLRMLLQLDPLSRPCHPAKNNVSSINRRRRIRLRSMTGHWYLSFTSSFQFRNYLLWFLEETYRIDLDTVVLYTKIPLRPLIRIRVCNTLDTEVA